MAAKRAVTRVPRPLERYDGEGVPVPEDSLGLLLVRLLPGRRFVHDQGERNFLVALSHSVSLTSRERRIQDGGNCYYLITVDTYADGTSEIVDEQFLGCDSGTSPGGGGDGGGGGDATVPPGWSASTCENILAAAQAGSQSVYVRSTKSGNEYGGIIAYDQNNNLHYSAGITNNSPDQIDFGPVLSNLPTGWIAIGYYHIHPGPYQNDSDAINVGTDNHFSYADEQVAYTNQINGFVVVGGTTDFFEWTPPFPDEAFNEQQPDTNLGSVNSGDPGC